MDLVEQLAQRLSGLPWAELELAAARIAHETVVALKTDLPCVSQARAEAIGEGLAHELRRRWRQEQAARRPSQENRPGDDTGPMSSLLKPEDKSGAHDEGVHNEDLSPPGKPGQ